MCTNIVLMCSLSWLNQVKEKKNHSDQLTILVVQSKEKYLTESYLFSRDNYRTLVYLESNM